ncbi:hypothetical protein QBC45DRAFT_351791 [Copromyces sp. CBS 386.78]|uniref:60S ribosomal subunit assembly/export protein LOC1 n=1 Tax=Pseudoneurospora amorphoporcata TaxID=241081 RepID=A0AAN6NVG4_9PEZI|nr:hypothetical protein QBC45DRAFT_351791 [Copromyces sp. CBS 386.78]KAK3952807.1 hypothetical protein QBC32DRAFT_324100 [Pseudoneurospora amorphoporcata]
MAPTKTIKNKHAANKSGIKGSKDAERSRNDGVLKSKGKPKSKTHTLVTANKGRPDIKELIARKQKKRKYSEKELAGLIPELNMVTPVGVSKPKGKKKGKVFVDDKESMATILAIVQAEKEGQIESKMIKARQMEEIREARRVEADKKEAERKARLEETKDSLRKKRKRSKQTGGGKGDDDDARDVKNISSAGTNAFKSKKKKSVSFAAE